MSLAEHQNDVDANFQVAKAALPSVILEAVEQQGKYSICSMVVALYNIKRSANATDLAYNVGFFNGLLAAAVNRGELEPADIHVLEDYVRDYAKSS